MIVPVCTACNSSSVARVEPRIGLIYVCCRACGHCVLVPHEDDTSRSFDEAQEKYYGESSQLLATEPDLFEAEILAYRVAVLGALLPRPSDVLEVGPGGGHVLRWLLAHGHNVTAIEHSSVLARQLSERLEVSVKNGEFEAFDLSAAAYDAFCSFHVIEHVRDPVAHLSRAYSLLRPGGLAFVATPNARSWQQMLFASLSPNFDSAHLYVFSPQSLRRLCEQSGWEVISTLTPDCTAGWARFLTKAIRRIRREDEEQTAGKYARSSSRSVQVAARILQVGTFPLRFIQSKLGYGNEVFLVLRKPLASGCVGTGDATAHELIKL